MQIRLDTDVSLETLIMLSRDLRTRGKTVGFTHGTFDLFHIGHLTLLTEASKQCDFLVVAIESDKNVASYKDIVRPIINENDRLSIVNSVSRVSTSFINHLPPKRETYEDYYYKELSPNKIFIGRNFAAEENLRSEAGRLRIKVSKVDTDLESTSRIIESIVKKTYLMQKLNRKKI